jgi:hypothetical protein
MNFILRKSPKEGTILADRVPSLENSGVIMYVRRRSGKKQVPQDGATSLYPPKKLDFVIPEAVEDEIETAKANIDR